MDAQHSVVSLRQEQQGLGLITFYAEGGCTALIRPVSNEAWQRGQYVPGIGLSIENDAVQLSLKAVAHPTENGPRMRGEMTLKETGETSRVVAWRVKLEDGTPALGISADRPLPNRVASPF